MTNNPFQKAVKQQVKLRLALLGPAGSGKTYSALEIAKHLGGKTALMDTEHQSARKYADIFEFDVVEPDNFSPDVYIEMIQMAEQAGYDNLILDSLSHAWAGKGGILEYVDEEKRKSRSGNAFTEGWGKATPKHNALIEAMLSSKLHLIVTMRTKMEYVIEEDPNTHKKTPRKIGLQPIQRDGLEYEFDVVGDMNQDNEYSISKTRCPKLYGKVIAKPGKQLAEILKAWLADGVRPEPPPPTPAPVLPPTPPTNGNGNGHKPEPQPTGQSDPASIEHSLDDLGEKLWPGLWVEKKPMAIKASNGDMSKTLENAQKRQEGLADRATLRKHIAASWPGYETTFDKLIAQKVTWKDPLCVVRGVSRASAANTMGELNDEQLVSLVLTELEIPEF